MLFRQPAFMSREASPVSPLIGWWLPRENGRKSDTSQSGVIPETAQQLSGISQ